MLRQVQFRHKDLTWTEQYIEVRDGGTECESKQGQFLRVLEGWGECLLSPKDLLSASSDKLNLMAKLEQAQSQNPGTVTRLRVHM